MTIIEAIKSGKRFRRTSEKGWLEYYDGKIHLKGEVLGCDNLSLCATDILADDWEVEEQKVEINRLALCSAWVRAHCGSLNCDQFEGFARELGFK